MEVLAFINCIVQIFFTDFFLGYEFTTFGTDVLNYVGEEGEDRPDPFKHVFPKVNNAPKGSIHCWSVCKKNHPVMHLVKGP